MRQKRDPWGYAAQDRFTNFVSEQNLVGKRALSTVLIKLIIDNSDTAHADDLKKLEDDVWKATTQDEIISIIDDTIKIVNEMRS